VPNKNNSFLEEKNDFLLGKIFPLGLEKVLRKFTKKLRLINLGVNGVKNPCLA